MPPGRVALPRVPDLAARPLLCIASSDDVDERVRLLEAGADDVIARPFHPDELQARVDALLAVPPPPPNLAANGEIAAGTGTGRRRARLVLLPEGRCRRHDARGQHGRRLARRSGRSVALVDLDLEWGQVATQLNLSPRFSVVEMARDAASLDDPELIRGYANRHSSGISAASRPPYDPTRPR